MKKDKLPIRYTFPAEAHIGLWGGVGVLQGERFARGYKLNRRFKKEWRPLITKEYFHSELANDGQYLQAGFLEMLQCWFKGLKCRILG